MQYPAHESRKKKVENPSANTDKSTSANLYSREGVKFLKTMYNFLKILISLNSELS